MDTNELIFLNAFNSIPGVGVATLRLLKSRMGSFEHAWKSDLQFLATGAFSHPIAQIHAARSGINPEKEFQKLEQHEIWMISEDDPLFPAPLREIPHAPLLLYGKGTMPDMQRKMIGIVGTRRPTAYGKEVAQTITKDLGHAGLMIASGLAIGIDTIAHRAALSSRAPTVAVLGSGIDDRSLWPQENIMLCRAIVESGGAVISEYAPGARARKEYFPLRNRIIAGLSRGILVVEARERSGALITAQMALEQNRDVFAIPGSIFSPTSVGTNLLIQQGAKLVMSAQDIFQDWGIEAAQKIAAKNGSLDTNEKIMLKLLEQETDVDTMRGQTDFDTPMLMSLLTLLELKGYIRQTGNNMYRAI